MTTHCSILAWKIPWTEEPGEQQVYRVTKSQLKRLNTHIHTYIYNFLFRKVSVFSYKETKNSGELIILILCVNDYCYFTTKNVSTVSVKQKQAYLTKYRQ